eukprot:scaffold134_cov94-Amphora_coffeaeformis.AAC.15
MEESCTCNVLQSDLRQVFIEPAFSHDLFLIDFCLVVLVREHQSVYKVFSGKIALQQDCQYGKNDKNQRRPNDIHGGSGCFRVVQGNNHHGPLPIHHVDRCHVLFRTLWYGNIIKGNFWQQYDFTILAIAVHVGLTRNGTEKVHAVFSSRRIVEIDPLLFVTPLTRPSQEIRDAYRHGHNRMGGFRHHG